MKKKMGDYLGDVIFEKKGEENLKDDWVIKGQSENRTMWIKMVGV